VLLAVLALDQLVKAIVMATIQRGARIELVFGLDLVHVRNKGVAFGALADGGAVVAALTAVALVVLIVYFALHSGGSWTWLATGLLLGGAAGNLLDRARHGAVIDFVDFPLWPAFNLADAAITCGVLLLVLGLDRDRRHDARGDPSAA